MKFGKIIGEPLAEYHSSDAVSNSKLKEFRRDPEIYFRRYIEKSLPKKSPTSALEIGQAVDLMVLEGASAYAERVAILPADFNGRTNAGKALVDSHEKAGKTVLTQDEASLVEMMAQEVYSHEDAKALDRKSVV